MRIFWGVGASAAVALLLLSGCVQGSPAKSTSLGSPRVESSSQSPSISAVPTPMPTPTATRGAARIAPGMVGRFPVEIPVDLGPREYATGTVMLDSEGVPASYRVSSGDVIDYVAERFGFYDPSGDQEPFAYLNTINQVRRGTYDGAPDSNFQLYAVLNLSPYTIATIGNENGKVLSGPMPSPAPPQK